MDNQKTKPVPTMRFNLPLSEPTDDQYNEFSYAKIVSDSVKKVTIVIVTVLVGRVGFCEMEGYFSQLFRLLKNTLKLVYFYRNKNKNLRRIRPTIRN